MFFGKKRAPYVVLILLFGSITVLGSVRYGQMIQKQSQANEYIYKIQQILSLTPTPRAYSIPSLQRISNVKCGVSFALPSIATNEAQITCIAEAATSEAYLKKAGFVSHAVNPFVTVYVKGPTDLVNLISETLETL